MVRDLRAPAVRSALLAGIMSVFTSPLAAQTPPPVSDNVPITSISVTAFGGASATVGQTRQVSATATLNDGSTRVLGGGSIWNIAFGPGIPVQTCNTAAVIYTSQNWSIDPSGAFSVVWSPGSPNTLTASGTMSMPTAVPNATVSANLSCVSTPTTGSVSAQWSGTHYAGTYTFGAAQGSIAVVGLTWTSSNPAVATVDQFGTVTALAPGDVIITGTFGSQCWQMMPGATNCFGTVSGSVSFHVDPVPGGGGGGGGNDEDCATLTLALAPGSAPMTEVNVTAIDPATGDVRGSFTVPIGEPQTLRAGAFRLRFTAPEGFTVTPEQVDFTTACGDSRTVSLRFDQTATIDTLIAQAQSFSTDLLKNARARLMAGNVTAACNQLGAFMHHVGAQSGKGLSQEYAADLLASSAGLRTALGCR